MAKPDPILLESRRYPLQHEIVPRFQDLDPNRHINNVALAAYFEDARVHMDRALQVDKQDGDSPHTMIASLAIEYLDEAFYPDPIQVHIGILSAGKSSWTIAGIAVQDGRVAAFSRAVMVNLADGRPAPLSKAFRDEIGRFAIDTGDR